MRFSSAQTASPRALGRVRAARGHAFRAQRARPFACGISIQKLEKEPNRGEWWQLAGYGHMQAGELTVARDCFLRVTQLLPEEVTGWNLYASTLTRLGDTRAARRALDKALQTDPTSTTAWVLLGDLDAAANRRVEAARAYERALDQDRGNIFAWYGIGLLAKRTNDAAALERAVKALRQLYPEFADELEKKA